MDKFLVGHKLPKLTQEADNSDHPILVKEIKFAVKIFSTKKTPGLSGLTNDLYQTFKDEILQF